MCEPSATGRIEHIVIDGGSGDDVVNYLSGCEPGFTYWQSEPDGGRYDAMNQGIAHASGDLLWFMHSGDRFSEPDAVAPAVEAISRDGSARDVWGYGMDNLLGLDRVRAPIPFKLRKFLAGSQVVPHQASFFGSSLVGKIGGYDLDFGIAADQEFILRAALAREPITIRRVLCEFDTTGVGSTRSAGDHYRDWRRLCDLLGYYLLGGRRTSLAYMRLWEYMIRAKAAAARTGRLPADATGGRGIDVNQQFVPLPSASPTARMVRTPLVALVGLLNSARGADTRPPRRRRAGRDERATRSQAECPAGGTARCRCACRYPFGVDPKCPDRPAVGGIDFR